MEPLSTFLVCLYLPSQIALSRAMAEQRGSIAQRFCAETRSLDAPSSQLAYLEYGVRYAPSHLDHVTCCCCESGEAAGADLAPVTGSKVANAKSEVGSPRFLPLVELPRISGRVP